MKGGHHRSVSDTSLKSVTSAARRKTMLPLKQLDGVSLQGDVMKLQ